MEQLKIQTHNFDKAKNQLKQFSEKVPQSMALETVSSKSGLFNLFKHNVTGEELNNLTAQIQKYLITLNSLHIKSIKEFGQVYEALEALDKDYIQAIILSIKAAEKASEQAKQSASKAMKNSRDIDKAIKVQEKMITILSQFKEQVEQYEQLENIDELWSDSQTFKEELQSVHDKFGNVNESIGKQTQAITVLEQFKKQLDQYKQLENIDELWSDSQAFKEELQSVHDKFGNVNESIGKQMQAIVILQQFKEQIDQYEQLENIDELWSDSQKFKSDIKAINLEVENQKEKVNFEIEEQIRNMYNLLKQTQVDHEDQNKRLSKKIKVAYILAGSAAGVTVINLVLTILGNI